MVTCLSIHDKMKVMKLLHMLNVTILKQQYHTSITTLGVWIYLQYHCNFLNPHLTSSVASIWAPWSRSDMTSSRLPSLAALLSFFSISYGSGRGRGWKQLVMHLVSVWSYLTDYLDSRAQTWSMWGVESPLTCTLFTPLMNYKLELTREGIHYPPPNPANIFTNNTSYTTSMSIITSKWVHTSCYYRVV